MNDVIFAIHKPLSILPQNHDFCNVFDDSGNGNGPLQYDVIIRILTYLEAFL
jgi:hypothetical protein